MVKFDGFTLMELLVVITIITILAAVAMPVFQRVILSAEHNAAMQTARNIGAGLQLYAMDSQGLFPRGTNRHGEEITNANDAFRDLVPDYIDDERAFVVPKSQWGARADNKVEPPEEILKSGENHYAYVMGLSQTSRSGWPLVVDGTDGGGFYTEQEGQRGGRWLGNKATVIRVDLSAEAVRLKGSGDRRYLPKIDDDQSNALLVEGYMPDGVTLLEPAGG